MLFFSDVSGFPHAEAEAADIPQQHQQDSRAGSLAKGLCQAEAEQKIKDALAKKWRDRTLREIKKDKFVALWTYQNTYPWSTLNDDEKKKLQALVDAHRAKEEGLWKKQASDILQALTNSVDMVPCGEDLGVNLAAVPQVMGKTSSTDDASHLSQVGLCEAWMTLKQESAHVVSQTSSHRTHLQGMGQSVVYEDTAWQGKYLCLVLQSTERS